MRDLDRANAALRGGLVRSAAGWKNPVVVLVGEPTMGGSCVTPPGADTIFVNGPPGG